MKIINKKPPVWDSVCKAFNILPKNVLFTYGDIIYNPDSADLPHHIIVHEEIHEAQQTKEGMTPELWWGKFLREPKFRLDQESEAYAAQYKYFCEHNKDRNTRARFLMALVGSLSGPLYGNIITTSDAMKLIKLDVK